MPEQDPTAIKPMDTLGNIANRYTLYAFKDKTLALYLGMNEYFQAPTQYLEGLTFAPLRMELSPQELRSESVGFYS